MFELFKSHILYVRIFKRKIEIRNLNTDQESKKESIKDYSNDRLVIANFGLAEEFLRQQVKEVCSKPNIKILIQPIDENIKDFSQVEIRSFLDSAEHAGAKIVAIDLSQKKLSDQEVIHILDKNN